MLDPVFDDAYAGNLAVAEEISDALAGCLVREVAEMSGIRGLGGELSWECIARGVT